MNEYYIAQAGSGYNIKTFAGDRYQKGNGFFGRFFSSTIMPLLKKVLPYLGKQALDTGIDIASQMKGGTKFKQAAKSGLKRRASQVAEDALIEVKNAQTGDGIKRRRKKKKKKADCEPIKGKTAKEKTSKSKKRRKKSVKFLF